MNDFITNIYSFCKKNPVENKQLYHNYSRNTGYIINGREHSNILLYKGGQNIYN